MQDFKWIKVKNAAVSHVMQGSQFTVHKGQWDVELCDSGVSVGDETERLHCL